MIRNIIIIDQNKCNGCGQCMPNCPEGAIQIIDNKARLVSDLFCDGLGACIGHCPEGAITIEKREAVPYDEKTVMGRIVEQGPATVKAHLEHLKDHKEFDLLKIAQDYLKEKNIPDPLLSTTEKASKPHACGCPGSHERSFKAAKSPAAATGSDVRAASELTQWPVQMHLVSPMAPYFKNADVVIAADCVAYALGSFHQTFLAGKKLAIACPKLDEGQEIYREKIRALIDDAVINSLTVIIMEVPCCRGLLRLVQDAQAQAKRKIDLRAVVVGLEGDIKSDDVVTPGK